MTMASAYATSESPAGFVARASGRVLITDRCDTSTGPSQPGPVFRNQIAEATHPTQELYGSR